MKKLYVPLIDLSSPEGLDESLELHASRFEVCECNWKEQFPYVPFCSGRIARSEEALIVDFRVSGLDLRVRNLRDGGHVWEDSCCEIFIQIPGREEYFNFEVNAAGYMVAAQGSGRSGRIPLAAELMSKIERKCSVSGAQESSGTVRLWRVSLIIPFSVMGLQPSALPHELKANIYKCGDLSAHPHFLSWAPIDTPSPDFHRPEFFGSLVF